MVALLKQQKENRTILQWCARLPFLCILSNKYPLSFALSFNKSCWNWFMFRTAEMLKVSISSFALFREIEEETPDLKCELSIISWRMKFENNII